LIQQDGPSKPEVRGQVEQLFGQFTVTARLIEASGLSFKDGNGVV
jgi:hypothetical protein